LAPVIVPVSEENMRLCVMAVCTVIGLVASIPSRAGEIHDAARRGAVETVKSLIETDADLLDARDALGDTPLTLAAAYARWDLFRYLLSAGADVNVVTRPNATAMHSVCYHDRPDMVALLLGHGGGACLTVKDSFGEYTPMLRAVQRGNRRVVAFLLENGASVDEATKEGWNALHLAAKSGHRHLYGLLIDSGVSLDALDRDGNAPMKYDFRRRNPVPLDAARYDEYAGRYNWQGTPGGIGVDVFVREGMLMLDDNCLNEIYPIGEDTFYCRQDPWEVRFFRSAAGAVDRVELVFLRRSVMLKRMNG
jgi:hypothetical protein